MAVSRIIRWILRGTAALVVLLLAASAGIYLWLRTSLPQLDGTLTLPGLHAAVTVSRDRWGIPHIVATDEHDAAFALGFVHAQDRMFQMDLLRRYGEGRTAELEGKAGLARDRLMRTLGITQAAEQEWALLKPAAQAELRAYAAGVNAYLAHHGLPQPFYAIVSKPSKWRPVDTIVIAKVMALYLSQNFRRELRHAIMARRLSPEQMRELFPSYPKDGFVTLARRAAIFRKLPLRRLASLMPPGFVRAEASNNWVLAGSRTVTGKPILENDPHLTYMAPGVWYLARIDTPTLHLAGATVPGTPFVVIGHNDHVGWGFTETGGDAEDLFVEKVDPHDPSRYLVPGGGSQPFATRKETIHVKGSADVTITVRATRHGPVISDVAGGAAKLGKQSKWSGSSGGGHGRDDAGDTAGAAAPEKGYVVALEATFLQRDDLTAQAFWGIDHARSAAKLHDALRDFGAPEMNVVYADTGGTIGFIAAGKIPIRKKGDGWLPQPGWTGDYDWTGYIPFDRLPQAVDPPSGRLVTANNKIVPDDYPYFISRDWAPPFRAERIAHLLEATPKQSVASTEKIAADTVSLMARKLLPIIETAHPAGRRAAAALALLERWNGDMARGDAAPLIFTAWLREVERELFAQPLGPAFDGWWRPRPTVLENILAQKNSPWCRPASGSTDRGCAAVVGHALDVALDRLSKRFGNDMAQWHWGAAHQADFHNPVLAQVPLLGDLLRLRVPVSGGSETVNAGDMDFSDGGHPFLATAGPGLRMVLDFSDLSKSHFLMAPGTSGNPLSPHYGDLIAGWRGFAWMTIAHAAAVDTLRLTP